MRPRRLRLPAVVTGSLVALLACIPASSAQPATATSASSVPTASTPAALAGPGAPEPSSVATAPAVTPPPPGARFDYQLGGAYPPAAGVGVVARDRTAPPAPGIYSVCYVNAFQTQPDESAWWTTHHPDLVLTDERGRPVEDAGWPGEYLLDTRTAADRTALAAVVGQWVDQCAAKGYRAVELDNLDSWLRSGRLLAPAGNLAYAELLVERAHTKGLAVAQKNAPELTAEQVRATGFDFAIAEECEVYDECEAYTALHGRHVVEIEYTDNGHAAFCRACATRGRTISVLLRDRDVLPLGRPGYLSQYC